MKFHPLIICLFFLSGVQAQTRHVRISTFEIVDQELQSFIQLSQKLKFVDFDSTSYKRLSIKPDTSFLYEGSFSLVYSGIYDFNYKGHQFLFTEQFGQFPLTRLQKILDSVKIKNKGSVTYEGRITKDNIHIKITNTYYTKAKNNIFIAIDNDASYPGGKTAFQKYISGKIKNGIYAPSNKSDSAFFIQAVLKKDSLIHSTKLFDSIHSNFRDLVQNILKESRGWKPANQSGRDVNKYLQVFILVRKDGSIEADYH